MTLEHLFSNLWEDYKKISPIAEQIHAVFSDRGETIVNDHIALRTYDHPRLGIESLAKTFKKRGYIEKQDYHFPAKKLYAKHYEHADEKQPKIFISELKLREMSSDLQKKVEHLIDAIPQQVIDSDHLSYSGRPWNITYNEYESLAEESEYAGWVAAFGFRANHFTVSVNHLQGFNDIVEINELLKSKGFPLNASGGEVKGSKVDLLEQSSTLAPKVIVPFTDGEYEVPGCYYEFAKRYPGSGGQLYTGFVAASADKIFESTDRQQS